MNHPDTDRLSDVIKCEGQDGNGFIVGDNGSDSYNPNGSPWNETRRVLSFWYKGSFSPIYVAVSTSSGHKFLQYFSHNGTSYEDGSGNVWFYLGTGAATTDWNRFERNIEEDWESISSAGWQNTDGMLIRPRDALDYDMYFDDIRFSNSRTKTHHSLGMDRIGQIIIMNHEYMVDNYGQPTDIWMNYDHIGKLVNISNFYGYPIHYYNIDSFGNDISSLIDGSFGEMSSGYWITNKNYDEYIYLYYYNQRWYNPLTGIFISNSPYSYNKEHPYLFCNNNPLTGIDWSGEWTVSCNDNRIKKRLPTTQRCASTINHDIINVNWGACIEKMMNDPKTIISCKKTGECARGATTIAHPTGSWFKPKGANICPTYSNISRCYDKDMCNIITHELAHHCGMPHNHKGGKEANIPGSSGSYVCSCKKFD